MFTDVQQFSFSFIIIIKLLYLMTKISALAVAISWLATENPKMVNHCSDQCASIGVFIQILFPKFFHVSSFQFWYFYLLN